MYRRRGASHEIPLIEPVGKLDRGGQALAEVIESLLDDQRSAGRFRSLSAVRPVDATHLEIDGRPFVNFCSNNYLALSRHPRVIAAVENAVRQGGFGSGAAALICGYWELHQSAERAIARWKRTEAAVLVASGYQANHAAVQTLAAVASRGKRKIRFLVDKLVHASILDAVSGSNLPVRIFPHNNLSKLARLLADTDDDRLDVVVTESIFSMDGDAAELAGIVQLKAIHPFVLLLDEAHASGVYGTDGAGYADELGVHEGVDISIVTLSKALGGMGGAICGTRGFCQGVVNFGRAFIYTTNVPPAAAAAAEAAIDVLRDEPQRSRRVRQLAIRVRHDLAAAGMGGTTGDSPIICVKFGSEEAALAGAAALRADGLLVTAVRPPTVAPGSSRLRVTLCCDHTDEEVYRLTEALRRIFPRP